MIQANELRIGNLVKDRGGKILKLDYWEGPDKIAMEMTFHGFPVHAMTEYIPYLQPIPLTPEILEKCGFKKWKGRVMENTNIWMKKYEHEAGYFDVDNKPVINTSTIGIRQYYGHSLPDEFFYTDHHSKIEHLHQLQNLYFALTGEELDVELLNNVPNVQGSDTTDAT
jgi:hypothetical protein